MPAGSGSTRVMCAILSSAVRLVPVPRVGDRLRAPIAPFTVASDSGTVAV